MQPHIKSLGTALELLGYFASERRQWRVTDLAARVGLHKSEVSRILRTFEAYGFIQRRKREYLLGRAFKTYASLVKTEDELSTVSRSIMQKLSKETQGTVLLKIREGGESITIDRVESQHFLRLAYPVGLRLPLNASSSGKVFLAGMSDEQRNQIYRSKCFKKFTARTKTKSSDLEKDLAEVRRRGYAVSDEEHLLGARGLAAPILGPDASVEASLGLGLPTVLLPDDMIEATGMRVRKAAEEISLRLGYRPRHKSENGKTHFNEKER